MFDRIGPFDPQKEKRHQAGGFDGLLFDDIFYSWTSVRIEFRSQNCFFNVALKMLGHSAAELKQTPTQSSIDVKKLIAEKSELQDFSKRSVVS